MSKNKKDETALELDDILSQSTTNSHRLAAFLQRKAAEAQKPRSNLVFGNFSYDLDFDVPLIKKPQKGTQENQLKPLQELGAAASEPPASDVPQSPPNLASHENVPPRSVRHSPSPTHRRPPRRSGTGGHVPGSDKLRRHAIQRRSRSCGRRQLLQDFDDAANLTRSSSSPFPFVPEISSTPNCSDKLPENQPASQPQPKPASHPQPQPLSEPLPMSQFSAEIAEICEQRLAMFENSILQMSQKAEVRSSLPGSRPLTPSERHRTYTIEKRPMTEKLQQSRSSPNTSHSKTPLVRVRRLENSMPPDTPNYLHQSERESAPVEDCFVPETQPQQSQGSQQIQQLAEIVQNLSRSSSVLVIPMGGALGPKPDAAEPLPQPHSPAAPATEAAAQDGAAASPTVSAGTPKSCAPAVSAGTPKSSKSKPVSHNKTPQVVEDLDAIMTDDESDEQPSGCALNLAPAGGNTSRRSRRRTRNSRKPSDDQESSMKLLNLHRSNPSGKTKRKGVTATILNKAPCPAINGEAFAKELERMSNHEILDLRKRNSLGRVYPLNGKRKHSAEQQKALEQQIQWELLQRNLEVETETETETESLSRSASAEREEMDYREEVMAMPPPAPVAFKDNSKERQNVRKRSRRREAPMTAELVNYMELSKTMELRRKPSGNSSKRSLYTKGDSFREDDDSVSPEKQPRLSQTRPGSTLGRARSKESHDVVQEDIFIVPPPPRSLRYSQCVRDLNRLRATPQDSTDEDTPLCHLKGQNNNLNEIASPPPEFNDNNDNEMDGADCSSSGQAQHRLSKSPLPPVERSEFDDQSVQKANKNRRSRQSRLHKVNSPSPEKNKTTDTHREDLAIVSSSVPGTTSMTDDQPSTSRAALDALARRAIEPDPDPEPDPEPEPEPEAEPEPVLEEEAVVFKKPKARAPRTKSRANRELENLKHSFMHDDVEVDSNETGNRRSKRGQVPLKNTWCHTMDPMKFDFFRKSVETYDRIKAKPKPSSKQSSMSKLSKMSLLKRPPLCSSTPRISEEPLNAVTETIEPPEPSDCSSLGIAPLRWEDNEQIEQVESSDARKQTKKRGRTKKKRQESAAAASMPLTPVMETETETDPQPDSVPDPITPINAPTPSPSISDEHQASYMQLMSWLRGHSSNQPSSNMEDSSGSGVGNTVFASELLFTNLDDIEYAFYETKERATLGYMRLQPLQSRRKKRARSFSLKFVVLFGKFALDCTVPDVAEDDHRILNIGDMAEIEKGTRFGFSNLLNEVSVLMVIRH
ncbi:uncharacterized protein LOC117898806 isoform X2 [Drosophila subobscura]|uniref:uncharacterized protein LOC117898806 isoform X2 n=1 Tax=Drosophila subobscura TaxID=7241 RepID=UPI00155AB9C6|nr:uncharacterized protein LOC117898806 isoform X2 [Drosophila subobscura]